jgi:hypothetical protein
MRKVAEPFLAVGAAVASIVCLYYPFFFSGGNLVSGDLVDNRLYITILQHWQSVFAGRAPMASPNFFAPHPGSLALSESMFLFTPFYSFFSLFGADRPLAFQLTLFGLRLMGFLALYALLRRHFRFAIAPALFGAALFTISNIFLITEFHGVFAALDYLPVVALLVMEYWNRRSRACLWVAAVLASLLFFTCYYMAFFSGFAAIVFVLCLAPGMKEIQRRARARDIAAAAILFGLALIPFLMVYLPSLKVTGGRPYGEALLYARDWREIADIGDTNLIWGSLLSHVYDSIRTRGLEWGRGWPPVTLLTAFGAFAFAIVRKRRAAAAIGAACAILYLLTVKFGKWSLWWLVYHLVPGADGTRVPGRMNHVITFGIVILCSLAIHELWTRGGKWRAAAWGLGCFLLVEQMNHSVLATIDRSVEREVFGRIQPAPAACKTFFVTNVRKTNDSLAEDVGQMDAMLLAGATGIPTINGHSGWFPYGWDLHRFDADYPFEARTYAIENHLESGLCSVDFKTGEWNLVDPRGGNRYQFGEAITFGSSGNAGLYKGKGWSYAEKDASWTEYGEATLWLNLERPPEKDVTLHGQMLGFTLPAHPNLSFSVRVNGAEVGSFSALPNAAGFPIQATIPAHLLRGGYNTLTFHIDNPVSAAALGLSPDMRLLGLAVYSLRLDEASH